MVGVFGVVEDESRGRDPEIVRGTATFHFDASRVCYIETGRLFEGWHSVTARYQGGDSVMAEADATRDEVALYSLPPSYRPGHHFFLIGTWYDRQKLLAMQSEISAGPVPEKDVFYSVGDGESRRYMKNNLRHEIAVTKRDGWVVKQTKWIRGEIVEERTSPPWYAAQEVIESRR